MSKPAIPLDWARARLPQLIGSSGRFVDGDWVESKDQDPQGAVRLTQLADVGDGVWKNRSSRFLTREKARALRCTILERDDVLVARMPDPLGRSCLFPGDSQDCVTVVDVCIVRPAHGGVSTRWLSHFINTPQFRSAIYQLQSGSTRKRISRKNLGTLELPIPPTNEQHRLADALESYFSRLDDAVATLERVQRNLKRYRASVLKTAVEGRLVPTEAELARAEGRTYEPASALLERILAERRHRWEEGALAKMQLKGKVPKDDTWRTKYVEPVVQETSDLPELPEGWCWASVDQVGDVSGGITQNAKREVLPLKMPFLRVANVYANELRLGDIQTIGVDESEVSRARLADGDLLVVEGNGSIDQIGRVALWNGTVNPCLHQNHLIKVRFSRVESANWSLCWLLSVAGRRAIERTASSTSGLHTLSLSKVGRLPVPLAPLAEQSRAVAEVDRLLTATASTESEIGRDLLRCTRLRQSILKWAFEGRLVDQDPTDEPASVLLERIKAERLSARTARAAGAADNKKSTSPGRRKARTSNA